jgi:hypothetical protein
MLNILHATAQTHEGIDTWSSPASGLMARLRKLVTRQPARQTSDDIGDFIAMHGGVLTDDLERAISRKFGNVVGERM